MKSNLKRPNPNSFIKALLLGVLFSSFLASCNKDTSSAVDLPSGDATLSIDVAGIDDEDDGGKESRASVSKTSVMSSVEGEILNSKEVSFEGLDAIVSTSKGLKGEKRVVVANSKTGKSSSEKRAFMMVPGVNYRILLYLNGTFVKSIAAQSGVATHVEVQKDVEYDWYAFSFNSVYPIPDVSNTGAPTIDSETDRPLLYASGKVMVTGEGVVDKPLRIQFAHRTARVSAEISARGLFAGIQSVEATFENPDYIKKGTLNLLTGQYDNISPVALGNLNFVSSTTAAKDTLKVVQYYTAGQGTGSQIKINVKTLTLKLDKGDTRVFSNLAFSDNLDLNWGYRRHMFLDLIETPVTVAGVKWGRANLYFSRADRAYRFRHQITASYGRDTDEEYWNFKAPFPDGTIGAKDPCTLVYPFNKWRMPTGPEVRALIAVKDGNRNLQPDYVEYNGTGTAAPYPSNKLRVNKMGFNHVIIGEILGTLTEDLTNGYFWANETGFLGGALTGVSCYRVSDSKEFGLVGDYVWLHNALSSWGGRENVRCVRNE